MASEKVSGGDAGTRVPGTGKLMSIAEASDAQLELARDNATADLALALKYEHNARLVPDIRAFYDAVVAEQNRRAAPSTGAPDHE